MLTGGYPVAPFVPAAEDDPTMTLPPGAGLLAMPVPANPIADPAGYAAWRAPTVFASESLFDAAHMLGLTAALSGAPDFHTLHVDRREDRRHLAPGGGRSRGAARRAGGRAPGRPAGAWWRSAAPGPPIGTAARRRPSCRRWAAAARTPRRGARRAGGDHQPRRDAPSTPGIDFYGPGSSRHVPLILSAPACAPGRHRPARDARRSAGHRPLRAGGGDRDRRRRGTWATGNAGRWRPAADPRCRDGRSGPLARVSPGPLRGINYADGRTRSAPAPA